MTTPTDILREYGEAIRSDWSQIDGRALRTCLDDLADCIDTLGPKTELDPSIAAWLRWDNGICPLGGGHWAHRCTDYGHEPDGFDISAGRVALNALLDEAKARDE